MMAPITQFVLAAVLLGCVLAAPVHNCETQICKLFYGLDANHNGIIEASDMLQYLFTIADRTGTTSDEQIEGLLADLDRDASGKVTLDDFVSSFPRLNKLLVSGTEPQMTHLSFDNEYTPRVVVMWVTGENTSTSTVQYGTSPSALTQTFAGNTHTYHAGGWKGTIHEAHLPLLPAASQFYYRVGDEMGGWSAIFNFQTPPTTGTAPQPLVFGLFGDMGTAIPLGYKVCEQMEADHKKLPFNALLHVGDIAYASVAMTAEALMPDSDDGDGEVELVWDLWEEQVEPLAANIPYLTGVGNHERFYNFSAYLARFENPAPWGGSPAKLEDAIFWFGLDYGLVHFVFMSTEHPYAPGTPQYQWIEADLARVDRTRTPWVVLTGHRPMYSSDKNEYDSHHPGAFFQTQIEPLMLKYNVDMYICGHMHMYERIHPVYNGTVVQTGNVYRSPGAPLHVVQGTSGVFQETKYVTPQPAWSAVREGKLGYGRMHVFNATHVHYEFMYLQTAAAIDSFWLIK